MSTPTGGNNLRPEELVVLGPFSDFDAASPTFEFWAKGRWSVGKSIFVEVEVLTGVICLYVNDQFLLDPIGSNGEFVVVMPLSINRNAVIQFLFSIR